MWNLVRSVTGKEQQKPGLTKGLTVKHLNEHFSAMSTDPKYKLPSPKHTVPKILNSLLNGVSSVYHKPHGHGVGWHPRLVHPNCSRSLSKACNPSV